MARRPIGTEEDSETAFEGIEAFVNRGIGNQTTAQVLGHFHAHVAPLHPQTIILQVGINDLKTIPLFPEQAETIIHIRKR